MTFYGEFWILEDTVYIYIYNIFVITPQLMNIFKNININVM